MRKLLFLLILPVAMSIPFCLLSQTTAGTPETKSTVQPTIMVIPFAKEGQDIRKVLDAYPHQRVAIAKAKEAFDNRGFNTTDFVAKLKETEMRQVFTSDNLTDVKTQLIEYSGADIYVEVEATMDRSNSGNSAQVILSAYDASTAASLSNKVGFSGKFYTEDFGKLTAKATETVIEDFLNVMQSKFTDIVENGRLVALEFSIAPDSDLRMSTEIQGQDLPLSDALEVWMGDNALKGNYHTQGTSDLKILFDVVRIPLKDSNGNAYSTNKFALEVFKFCRTLLRKDNGAKVSVKKETKGGTIFITIG